ncbi:MULTISPECIES: hypothetical protein [Haloarcula]|uniref:hypothetical protein n=1 Tax=Haloarcula TaxID=2237 RepID=UPI0023E7854D|nr:hypothetical protein [Halomicroarcula sp. SHR3]
MDDNSERKKTGLTGLFERGNRFITRDSSSSSEQDGLVLDRRSYLAAAGLTTAALAGCADLGGDETVRPVSAYGYGGSAALQQTSSLTVSESEPNDRESSADAVSLGATVDATLTANDSDWYVVELAAGDDMVVEFSREAPDGVTAVILYDPDGTYSNLRYVSTDDPVTVAQTAETSGTYYIQVVDTQESDGDYTMTVGDGTTATPTPTETETETATPTATETATPVEDEYGEQGYGEYGYGGIAA